jgi:hypothetical protein
LFKSGIDIETANQEDWRVVLSIFSQTKQALAEEIKKLLV